VGAGPSALGGWLSRHAIGPPDVNHRLWADAAAAGMDSGLCRSSSKLDLFRYDESVIDLYAQISNRAFELCVTKQQLDGTEVASFAINLCRLGSA
jgi:hypothetical protein